MSELKRYFGGKWAFVRTRTGEEKVKRVEDVECDDRIHLIENSPQEIEAQRQAAEREALKPWTREELEDFLEETKDIQALKEMQLRKCPVHPNVLQDIELLDQQKAWIEKKLRELKA